MSPNRSQTIQKKIRRNSMRDLRKVGLAHAHTRFREGTDGGREGALESLRAIVRFLRRFDDDQISDLLQPVYALGWALVQLGDGVRAPMLAQPPKDGRPRDHQEWNAMKALAAMAVTILKDAGRPEREARDYVARALDNAGTIIKGSPPSHHRGDSADVAAGCDAGKHYGARQRC